MSTMSKKRFGLGYIVASLGLVLTMLPVVWMVLGAFKTQKELASTSPGFLPEAFQLDNFVRLFQSLDFAGTFYNSTVVALCATAGNLLFCSACGYALALLDFRGKKVIFGLVMGTLMIPGLVFFIPQFVLIVHFGLADTLPGLFITGLASPFGVFLMRQFMLSLPKELMEAARIDGAGEIRIFARIMLPLCGPALATLGILTFLGSWNSFLWPLVIAQSERSYTLPVALALFSTGEFSTDFGLLLAGALVVVLPVLVVFVFFQRRLIEGIATTGIK